MAKPKTSKRYTREFRQQMVELHRAGRSRPIAMPVAVTVG
jgi:transposase-like protein